jgi:hypothetical protein
LVQNGSASGGDDEVSRAERSSLRSSAASRETSESGAALQPSTQNPSSQQQLDSLFMLLSPFADSMSLHSIHERRFDVSNACASARFAVGARQVPQRRSAVRDRVGRRMVPGAGARAQP